MPKPGSPEWHAKVDAMMAEESRGPVRLWYMSFCDNSRPKGQRFVGGIFMPARGPTLALQLSHHLGINPGGEVATWEVPSEKVAGIPESMCCRLLSKQELDSM